MPARDTKSPETQEKERRKQAILAIFEKLYGKSPSGTMEYQFHQNFIILLEGYKKALLDETDYLDLEYDHPLRAARALESAIKNPGLENYQVFEKEATDSKFYPKTRAAASGILMALGLGACGALIFAIVVFSSGVSLGSALLIVGGAAAIGLYFGCLWGTVEYTNYAPVTNSIQTGRTVAENLNFFKPESKESKGSDSIDSRQEINRVCPL